MAFVLSNGKELPLTELRKAMEKQVWTVEVEISGVLFQVC